MTPIYNDYRVYHVFGRAFATCPSSVILTTDGVAIAGVSAGATSSRLPPIETLRKFDLRLY